MRSRIVLREYKMWDDKHAFMLRSFNSLQEECSLAPEFNKSMFVFAALDSRKNLIADFFF